MRNVSLFSMAPHQPFSGLVFEPFEELKHELFLFPSMPDQSIARQHFSDDCEAAANQQIKFVFVLCLSLLFNLFLAQLILLVSWQC